MKKARRSKLLRHIPPYVCASASNAKTHDSIALAHKECGEANARRSLVRELYADVVGGGRWVIMGEVVDGGGNEQLRHAVASQRPSSCS